MIRRFEKEEGSKVPMPRGYGSGVGGEGLPDPGQRRQVLGTLDGEVIHYPLLLV